MIPRSIMLALAATLPLAAEPPSFFAMDTGTRDATHQTPAEQITLVKKIGFDGISVGYSTPEALRLILEAADRQQTAVSAVYLGIDIHSPTLPGPTIEDAIRQLKNRDTILWLYVTSFKLKPSDPTGDATAVPALREIADRADAAGLKVALYPHKGFWLERVDDAVRLVRQVDRKNMGVTFNLCHWLAADGENLAGTLRLALPHLMAVTINGADTNGKEWNQLIQPLDSGTYDVGKLLADLTKLNWQGPIGLQHFGIPGNAEANLQRSMAAWKSFTATSPK